MRVTGRMMALLVGGAFALTAGFAVAQDVAATVKARQDHMKEFGAANKAINDSIKTGMPDKTVIGDAAKKVSMLAKQLPSWFPKGTAAGETGDVKTAAKPEIWMKQADFKADADKLATEADKLAAIAAKGDAAAMTDQAKAMGGTCGGCHMDFRVPPPPRPAQ